MAQSLKALLEQEKLTTFEKGYKATDAEMLGILVSSHGKWDGNFIFEVAKSAFEDSNFHTFNEKFEKLWEAEL